MYRPLQKDRIALNALTPNHGKHKKEGRHAVCTVEKLLHHVGACLLS